MEKQNYYGIKVANLERYKGYRAESIKSRDIAIMMQFMELDRIINATKFSSRFMNKSQSWFAQRVKNYAVNGAKAFFTDDEFKQIAKGYRELAQQLTQYADELDNAEMWETQD